MNLSWIVRSRVADRAPFRDRLEQVIASRDRVTVRCEVSCADSLGCALTQMQVLDEGGPETLAPEQLAARAERICDTVTYLLEPLRTIEVDQRAHVALIRSREPRRRGTQLSYYELLTTDDHGMSLHRYRFDDATRKRTAIPYVLTGDQLETLLDDLFLAAELPRN